MEKHILSKSTFVRGCQCTKSLFLYKKFPGLRTLPSSTTQSVFKVGTSVGELALQLFPGGKNAKPATAYQYQESVMRTQQLIEQGVEIIYEAAFQFEGVLAAIDMLVKDRNGWNAYEVKSSTSVKEEHILDTSLQYYVITNCGIQLNDISVVYINNRYTRNGAVDIHQLFAIESVKDKVLAEQQSITNKISELKNVLLHNREPDMKIGEQCSKPYECDFTEHCWKDVPKKYSVFTLNRLGKKAFELYHDGITTLDQIPPQFTLPASASFQLKHYITKEIFIERNQITSFLNQLVCPIYFFDFETYHFAVPEFNLSRPYQQIPFQYSLHLIEKAGDDPLHFEFLGDGASDPRESLIKQMLNQIGDRGSIVVYNSSFEKTRLKDFSRDFPNYSSALDSISNRLVDLMLPFQSKWYYNPDFEGSYSIKRVLPVLVPSLNYASLEIQEGGTASLVYSQLRHQPVDVQAKQRSDLLEYCKLDTLAMVKILQALQQL